MKKTLATWSLIAVSALVVGPIAGRLAGGVPADDGGPNATMLVNDALASGLFRTMIVMILAGLMGVVTSWASSMRAGLLATGAVLVWPAWTSAQVEGLLRTAQSGDPFVPLAAEGLILGAFAVVICIAISMAARTPSEDEAKATGDGKLFAPEAAVGFVAAIAVGGIAAWFIAREGLKGQTLAAGVIAAIAACTVGRVVAGKAPVAIFVAAIALLATAGPALGATIDGSDALAHMYANTLFPLARLAPLDWIAGAFLGAPIGLAWGASMLEKKTHH